MLYYYHKKNFFKKSAFSYFYQQWNRVIMTQAKIA